MTREEALRSYTIHPAHAAFEEDIKGSIEVGKLADFTVFSKDIMPGARSRNSEHAGRLYNCRREGALYARD